MNINMNWYEIMAAIEMYLKEEYELDFDFQRDCSEYPSIDWSEDVYAPKKHKNGKVMKHPEHGFVMQEVVSREKKYMTFSDFAEITIYIDPTDKNEVA